MSSIAPVRRSKARARATYDRRSRGYERIEGRFERRARLAGEHLLAVRAGERVLEIGSGPGAALGDFARAVGRDGHVLGVDIAPGMHRVAAERLRREGLGARVSLALGDGAQLPVRAHTFDAVFASFSLELFDTPDLAVVLAESRRVLRPAGRLAVVSLVMTEPPALMERVYGVAHRLMPALADCRPIPVAALVAEAGFRVGAQQRSDVAGIPVLAITARSPA